MAKIIKWTEGQEKAWDSWVSTRPPIIKDLCKRFPPYKLYHLKSSGHRVTLHSYSENGTITVNVSGEYNAVMFDRQVFGIKPEDLEECDMPRTDEAIGTVLTQEEDVKAFIDMVRPSVLADRN